MAGSSTTPSSRDLLTPVETTFKRMYLVSQDVFNEFKQFQDNNNSAPDSDPSSPDPPPGGPPDPPPGGPPGPPLGGPPGPPPGPSSAVPLSADAPRPGPSTQVQCMRKQPNGKPCKAYFDDQNQLNIHEQIVHHNIQTGPLQVRSPLSQAAIQDTANVVDQSMRKSIENSRLSSSVKDASRQNIDNTTLVQADVTQCRVCSFKGKSPEDLDRHLQDGHLEYYSLSRKMLQPKVMLKRLTKKMSLHGLQPKVNLKRLTPQAISLNKVDPGYGEQNQSQNNVQTMDRSVEPVAGPSSGTSTNPLRRSSRLNKTHKGLESTQNSPRNRAKRSVESYPKKNPTNPSKRRKVQDETLAQPLRQTQKSKNKRTADVQRVEIQPTNEEQRKNAFDLAVGRKKRKTKHTPQPPSKLWSSAPLPKKKKKRKSVKRLTDRYYKQQARKTRTKAHPTVQRNVAALGLSGY